MAETDRDDATDERESDDEGLLYEATRSVVEAAELIVSLF